MTEELPASDPFLRYHNPKQIDGEFVLGENGKVDAQKLQPITDTPMNHCYPVLEEKTGQV